MHIRIDYRNECSGMIKKQASENKRARTGTTLFCTKETKDQKTSIMGMCITGYSVMDNFKRQPIIHITGNAGYCGIPLIYLF